MSGSLLIVVIAAIVIVLLIVSFNIAWYRRQKQKHTQLQTSMAFEGNREEQHIQAQNGPYPPINGHDSLKLNQDNNPLQADQNVQVQPSLKWWIAEHVPESAVQDLFDMFNQYGQDPKILGWVAWDEQILCANRHYDEDFLDAVSVYISAVAHLQKELHMKQFLTAKIKGSDGELLLRKENQTWIALIVEDETKLTIQ